MRNMRNTEYWGKEGAQKTFTHPINKEWLVELDRSSSVLDLGCGYGRLPNDLIEIGFKSIVGFDLSVPLIERAICENPGASYTTDLPTLENQLYDLVLCFALFTTCPSEEEQIELTSLIAKCTQRNALLYISDYETEDNPHYQERYAQCRLSTYGCFRSAAAIFRHHESGHFDDLLPAWRKINEQKIDGKTLNGNKITIHQYLYRKS